MKAVERFNAKAYDRVALRIPKGWADELKEYVEKNNLKSVNHLLNEFIGRILDKSATNDTIIQGSNDTSILNKENKKPRKPRKPSPTQEMVKQWSIDEYNGESFAKIAKKYGYEKTTVEKRVKEYRKILET